MEEHEPLNRAIGPLRERGLRLAVDDAGAGYADLVRLGDRVRHRRRGIETVEELHTLRCIGVPLGQGYFLARPGPPPVPTDFSLLRSGDPLT